MEVIEYVGKIDDRMNRINKNYKYIGENIHNYINDGKIEYEQLMDFELSLQNLSIELNKLVYVFNQIENNETNVNNENPNIINTILQLSNNINQNKYNNNNKINNVNQENQKNQVNQENKMDKIDYALDKTIFHFLPLLFMYFMIFDNESILYIKDFIEKQDNTNNYTNNYNNNTFTPTPTKEEIIDDLD